MKIDRYQDIPATAFDKEGVMQGVTGRVAIGKKDGADHFCMRVFTLKPGGFTAHHTHAWEHEIFVHAGAGKVWQQGEWKEVRSGSIIFVPGNEEHQLKNDGDEEFVFVCLIPSGAPEL